MGKDCEGWIPTAERCTCDAPVDMGIPGQIPLTRTQALLFMDAQDILIAKPNEADWTDEDRQTLLDMVSIHAERDPS